jgi:hypothetical protein
VTRPRLALLQRVAKDVAQAARRRSRTPEGRPTADELARRLDETRERLRRDIPPPDSEYR